ncbi:MAG: DNA-processing protein DprA [Saccharofermentanales bacterium]
MTRLWDLLHLRSRFDEPAEFDLLRLCLKKNGSGNLLSQANIWLNQGINVVSVVDPNFPRGFADRKVQISLLFYRGADLSLLHKKCVAIVGSRSLNSYGREVTAEITRQLCSKGYCIVSGAAEGADSIAHMEAIKIGGKTIAVLGCGVDRAYPISNKNLLANIASSGLIISEYRPGTSPMAKNFPARNRIIAALAEAVIITTAKTKSGSLITAELAHNMKVPVYAIPGSIFATGQRGCHSLIKQGCAKIITDLKMPELNTLIIGERATSNDANEAKPFQDARINQRALVDPGQIRLPVASNQTEGKIFELLTLGPGTMEQIADYIGLSLAGTAQILTGLELAGFLTNRRGHYELNRFS